jgi:RNA polymerase sigma-70 factor (ECF subfamily)
MTADSLLLQRWAGNELRLPQLLPACPRAQAGDVGLDRRIASFRLQLKRWLLATTANGANQESNPAAIAMDRTDIQASLGGDGDAYARLIARYQQPVAAYMWRFTRDRAQWEELVHDVFVEAYFSLNSYRGEAPLLHWLKRIATRVGYRHWKHKRNDPSRTLADSDPPTVRSDDPSHASREAAELVHLLLSRLAPRDRLVITLSYLEGCSIAEISQWTGWSRSMVKVQLHRARQRLEALCIDMGIEL